MICNLSERAHASLKLLEASGQPQDLGEPQPPWWKHIYVLIGLGRSPLSAWLPAGSIAGKYCTAARTSSKTPSA